DERAASLESDSRVRIEAAGRGLERRAETVRAWRAMLAGLGEGTPERFVDWLALSRRGGRDFDVGMHRHWIDPTIPFAEAVLMRCHGALITSATLRDHSSALSEDWRSAEVRTGALHLPLPAHRVSLPSPFDYVTQTRIIVIRDVRRDDLAQVAAAYRELFIAAGGGALGLFTAIHRLRRVYGRIAPALDAAGLTLLAQHVDDIDTATLVDIFRAEPDSCLLGTDALRDGVDVPGPALRLIVFDRVPWPRPDILHRARRAAFGGPAYDDMMARLRIKQAYGRMVRRADDRGVFVMLDPAFPSRLHAAFPPGVPVRRLGLAEAIAETRRLVAGAPAE
ncbi:MAG: ATP-dependent DNA helicase, partial [Alphaproteobacteria bacterium]|nr:ATP-dependent DNA helicase [Alphaproteobacteria bacterium]